MFEVIIPTDPEERKEWFELRIKLDKLRAMGYEPLIPVRGNETLEDLRGIYARLSIHASREQK